MQCMIVKSESYNNDIKCDHAETFYGYHAVQPQES